MDLSSEIIPSSYNEFCFGSLPDPEALILALFCCTFTSSKNIRYMRRTLLTGLILLLISGACSPEKESPLEGAWKLAYEYEIEDGYSTLIYPGSSTGSEIKTWAGDRWALVGVFIEDSVVTDNFGGGRFTLDGTHYQEIVEYHSAKEYLGQTVQLYLEVSGDTLTQIWPVDEHGEPESSHHYMEKWVRFD